MIRNMIERMRKKSKTIAKLRMNTKKKGLKMDALVKTATMQQT